MKLMDKNYLKIWGWLLVISAIFLSVFSWSTSPIFKVYGNDSAVFIVMGKALAAGKVLYKDVFDHKGPILFFIEALGQLIWSGRMGIFLIQILNLTVVLYLARKISLLFVTQKQSWLVICAALIFLVRPLDEGNMTEELSLAFIMLPVFLALKDFLQPQSIHPTKNTFIYGLCFTIIAFIRITNAVAIVAIVFSIILSLIMEQRWRLLWKHAGVFIGASLVVILPLFAFFYSQDTLYDMLYGTFLFNLKYINIGRTSFTNWAFLLPYLYALVISFYSAVGAYLYCKQSPNKLLLSFAICLSLLSIYVSLSGFLFLHYQTINLVLVVLGVAFTFANLKNRSLRKMQYGLNILVLMGLSLPLFYFTRDYIQEISVRYTHGIKVHNYPEIKIPQEDKDQVIAYNVQANWYLDQNVLPCYKYFVHQDWWGDFAPTVWDDFNKMMIENSPLWIITPKAIKNTELEKILQKNYNIHPSSNDDYIVYTLKETI